MSSSTGPAGPWTREVEEFGRTLGEELLEPTKIYSLDCLALTRTTEVHAFSHVTGGGLATNLARVIPDGLHATVDRSTWTPAPVFDLVGKAGQVERLELEKTLNMGVGMIAVVPAGVGGRGADRRSPTAASTPGSPARSPTAATHADAVRRLTGDYAS